jgi:hypothetical protein
MGLKGTRFATMEDIKSNVTAELRKIPKEAWAVLKVNGSGCDVMASGHPTIPLPPLSLTYYPPRDCISRDPSSPSHPPARK